MRPVKTVGEKADLSTIERGSTGRINQFENDCQASRKKVTNSPPSATAIPLGTYHASEFGLEGFSDSLRIELMVHGIDVIVIGPAAVATSIWKKVEQVDISPYRHTASPTGNRKALHLENKQTEEAFPSCQGTGSRSN